MAQDNTPLDERLHSDHMQNAWYMGQLENSEFQFPFMSDNMLHHYFAASPFFDWTTKNGSEIKQCQQDPYGWQWSHNRKAFEESIASRNGQEYMIVEGEGMEFDKEGKPVKGGVWVIRKQERRKGADKGKDALETLATYYIVGESVYQAPSVGDILGTRLLSASTALTKCFSQAATLPQWSPTTGHTYPTSSTAATGSKHPTTSGSTAGSTPHSREGSVSTDFRANSSAPAGSSSSHGSSDALSNRLLTDSLRQSFTYADDPFTDENPLQGEPGSLTFVSSTAIAKQRKADAKAAEAAAKAKEESIAAAVAAAAAEAASKPATPVAASPTTPGKAVKKTKEKKKRRKSRHDAQSPPMSPAGGTPVGTPGPTSSG